MLRASSVIVGAFGEAEDDVGEQSEDEDGDERRRSQSIIVPDSASLPARERQICVETITTREAAHLIMTARQKKVPVP